ncbi:hypothetical protein EIP91_003002 [Steccherinum ochraceum]|uniref:Uncharacterized protein n=1 Tax=Steccherinum ochraceum TaxID=92696 RepID=A0A4R0RB18_9APHY|nr:hypothetical protein EIP91_003002 [Steccherinum ochraceum]
MPQQTDPALPVRLSTVALQQPSSKVRVAGRVSVPYNPPSPLIEISDGKHSLVVDVSLCLNPFQTAPWIRERQAPVMFIGYLEPAKSSELRTDAGEEGGMMLLRAIVARSADDLQLAIWDRAIQAREELEGFTN